MNGLSIFFAGISLLASGAPLIHREYSGNITNISQSSVGADLKALTKFDGYGDLLPSQENSLYKDFRYIASVFDSGSMYSYVVWEGNESNECTTYTTSDGTSSSRIGNLVSGHKSGKWFFGKYKTQNVYTFTEGTSHTVSVKSFAAGDKQWTDLNAQETFVDSSNGKNTVYSYYEDNWVVISKKAVKKQVLPCEFKGDEECISGMSWDYEWMFTNALHDGNFAYGAAELSWCLFDIGASSDVTSLEQANVIGIDYSYDLYEYEAGCVVHTVDGIPMRWKGYHDEVDSEYWMNGAIKGTWSVSPTTYDHDGWKGEMKLMGKNGLASIEKHIDLADYKVDPVAYRNTIFGWSWSQTYDYQIKTIQKLDKTSLDALEDGAFKEWCSQESVSKYDYAFLMDYSIQLVTYFRAKDGWTWITGHNRETVIAHDALNPQIYRIRFRKDNGSTMDFNVVDSTDNVEYLHDDFVVNPNGDFVLEFLGQTVDPDKVKNALIIAGAVIGGIFALIGVVKIASFIGKIKPKKKGK
ncbi:MAG: hypothetical protein IJS52_02980 [Bacilli bacterium]|nr:hypothetical protein [Bacilli bacterium]